MKTFQQLLKQGAMENWCLWEIGCGKKNGKEVDSVLGFLGTFKYLLLLYALYKTFFYFKKEGSTYQ